MYTGVDIKTWRLRQKLTVTISLSVHTETTQVLVCLAFWCNIQNYYVSQKNGTILFLQ